MGLLSLGTPLPWIDAKKYADHVREHGIEQFLSIYKDVHNRKMDSLLWGDEIEYIVVKLDKINRSVKLTSSAHNILLHLQDIEKTSLDREKEVDTKLLINGSLNDAESDGVPSISVGESKKYAQFAIEGDCDTAISSECSDSVSSASMQTTNDLSLKVVEDINELRRHRSSSNTLNELRLKKIIDPSIIDSSWKPEYGRFMLESTPAKPYGATIKDFLFVECNMINRRKLAKKVLKDDELILSLTNFPQLGTPYFYDTNKNEDPSIDPTDDVTKSLFIPTSSINPHARFPTLSANIRCRRGSKVAINLPIYKDVKTPSPFLEEAPYTLKSLSHNQIIEDVIPWSSSNGDADEQVKLFLKKYPNQATLDSNFPKLQEVCPDALTDHIYMDAMCFGMGCSCLQVTFQACSISDARRMYDQLANITPIMLSLSASAPFFRGFLVDTDCRWDVVSASVDDRTAEERGLKPLKDSKYRMSKSRYDSISVYLSQGPDATCCEGETLPNYYKEEYNDLNPPYDKGIYEKLKSNGIDELLSRHYGHLFTRDPLVIFRELINQDDNISSDHFENIQSTNWQTVRFKPPPPKQSSIGWRVEFRSMEIQLTDYENAAFSVFIVLFVRAVQTFKLNLYIPLSKVDINMKRSQVRDAVLTQKFWFRANINPSTQSMNIPDSQAIVEMTVDEIINGKPDAFGYEGLIPIVNKYLHNSVISTTPTVSEGVKISASKEDIFDFGLNNAGREKFAEYLTLLSKKASGEFKTGAKYLREFVTSHPDYKFDSRLTDKIVFDLVNKIETLNTGKIGPSVKGLNKA